MTPTASFFAGSAVMLGLVLVVALVVMFKQMSFDVPVPVPGDELVDPWRLQYRLMQMSGQATPALPIVNNTTLLYAALMLEEMAETFQGLRKVLGRTREFGSHATQHLKEREFFMMLVDMAGDMRAVSTQMRQHLKTMPGYAIKVSRSEAKEILDGTTDNAVVNAGFCIATGLPGAPAYSAVLTSNLSKANPDTGVIDKTPDGKWIKGIDYKEPDLDAVLNDQLMGYMTDDTEPVYAPAN